MGVERVTVFGSAFPVEGSPAWAQAFHVGRTLAERGVGLVNGGYGGTMAASARGAREAGGQVIGVTVETFTHVTPNPFLTQEMRMPDIFGRLQQLIALGDAFVVLPGGTGTLVELALVWEFLFKGVSRKAVLADARWFPVRDLLFPEPGAEAGRLLPPDGPFDWSGPGPWFCEDLRGALDAFLAQAR